VFDAEPPVRAAEVVGAVDAAAVAGGRARATVASVMSPPLPFVGVGQELDEALAVAAEAGAAVVLDAGLVRGVLTQELTPAREPEPLAVAAGGAA
jgi:cystathionine beta-synthase